MTVTITQREILGFRLGGQSRQPTRGSGMIKSVVPEASTRVMLCLGFVGIALAGAMSGRKRATAL